MCSSLNVKKLSTLNWTSVASSAIIIATATILHLNMSCCAHLCPIGEKSKGPGARTKCFTNVHSNWPQLATASWLQQVTVTWFWPFSQYQSWVIGQASRAAVKQRCTTEQCIYYGPLCQNTEQIKKVSHLPLARRGSIPSALPLCLGSIPISTSISSFFPPTISSLILLLRPFHPTSPPITLFPSPFFFFFCGLPLCSFLLRRSTLSLHVSPFCHGNNDYD